MMDGVLKREDLVAGPISLVNLVRAVCLISGKILLIAVALSFSLHFQLKAQSGRVQTPPKPKPKSAPSQPRLPEAPPAARAAQGPNQMPDQKPVKTDGDGGDTIRIASDLVTIVTTIPTNSAVELPRFEQSDFEIFEDGVKQEIANFARDSDQPINLVMLMDTSLSVAQKLDFEKKAMLRFLERVLRPQDRAALFTVSTEVTVIQEFTSQLSLLNQAARQMRPNGATSLYDGIFLAADYLRPSTGRKIIVIVSDGSDTTSQKGLLAALDQAQQADAMIYALYTGNFGISQNLRDLAGERALETLTAETGGELLRPRATPGTESTAIDDLSLRELDRSFTSLAEQLRTQYILGFFSSNERRDGSFRRLVVKTNRTGITPRTRRGYYAPRN
jgi:Ca-activated chloride channel homolog